MTTGRLIPWLVAAFALLVAGGCRRTPEVPEHVRQLEEQRREDERRRRETVASRPDVGAVGDEATWLPAVQQGYIRLRLAHLTEIPPAAQALAQLGRPALPALRRLAGNEMQSKEKRALVSFMLVELNLLRPDDLAALAREDKLPFVQRAAIESLARLGRPAGTAALDTLLGELREAAKGSPPTERSFSAAHTALFLEEVRKRAAPWDYTADQLQILDRVLEARTPQEVVVALGWVTDLTLEQGLEALATSPVVPQVVQGAIALRAAAVVKEDGATLRRLARRSRSRALRLEAARVLAASGVAGRTFVRQLAADPRDPLRPLLQRLLDPEPPKQAKSLNR